MKTHGTLMRQLSEPGTLFHSSFNALSSYQTQALTHDALAAVPTQCATGVQFLGTTQPPKEYRYWGFRFRLLPLMTTIGLAAFIAHRRFSSLLFSQGQLPLNPAFDTPS